MNHLQVGFEKKVRSSDCEQSKLLLQRHRNYGGNRCWQPQIPQLLETQWEGARTDRLIHSLASKLSPSIGIISTKGDKLKHAATAAIEILPELVLLQKWVQKVFSEY